MITIFIDESGDLGTKDRYFVIALHTQNITTINFIFLIRYHKLILLWNIPQTKRPRVVDTKINFDRIII